MNEITFEKLPQVVSDLYTMVSNIEKILLALNMPVKGKEVPPEFKYTPIQDIFKKKICSKPTFYLHLKKGEFTLYKFGNKSFVELAEFEK